MIGTLHDVEMVFDDHHGMPFSAEFKQHVNKLLHVAEGEACRRFIENVDGVSVGRTA